MIYIIIIFSFLLESLFSSLISLNSLLVPLFTITSLVILYPYFNNKRENFITVCLIVGLFYDIAFADSIFINTLSFGLVGGLIILGYNYINYNIFNSPLLNLLIIVIYRVISYLLLCIVDYIKFNETILIRGIYTSMISNLIYSVLIYLVINLIAKKFNIRKAE